MKLNPINGLHLLLVANSTGGCSKSTFAAEARVACAMEGIPFRLLTFDPNDRRLSRTFRGDSVYCLTKPNGEVLLESLGAHIDDARKNGELIIADMPACITDAENPIMKAFTDSALHAEFDSIGLLIPVTTNLHHIEGALDALATFKAAGIKHDRGLIRAWRQEPTSPPWDSFPELAEITNQFPVWDCPSYMYSMEDMIDGRGDFTRFPALEKLTTMLAEKGHTLSTSKRGQLRAAKSHLESAHQAVRTHLLAPITKATV